MKTIEDLLNIANETDDMIVHKTTSLVQGFNSPCHMDNVKLFKIYMKQYGIYMNSEIHKIEKITNSCNRTEWCVVVSA